MVDGAGFEEQIQFRSRREAKLLGKGVLQEALAAAGVGETYMRGDPGNVLVRKVRLVLEGCGLRASDSVRRALDDGPIGRLVADGIRLRKKHRISWRVVKLESRLRRHCIEDDAGADLDAIDAHRQDDAYAAEEAINEVLQRVSGARCGARALGVWSSVQRSLYRLDWATTGLGLAIEVAAIAGDEDLVTGLVQRSVYVLKDRGELSWSLSMAREVAARSVRTGDLDGLGKGLVDCAVVLSASGAREEAARCSRVALKILPENLGTSRFAAWQVLALSLHALADVEGAESAVERAAAVAPESLGMQGRLAWVRGRLAMGRKDLGLAERHYRTALSHLMSAPYDAALVGAELVRVVWRRGDFAAARTLSRGLSAVADAVSEHPLDLDQVMSSALLDLAMAGAEARLNEGVIERSVASLEKARAAAAARLKRRLRP